MCIVSSSVLGFPGSNRDRSSRVAVGDLAMSEICTEIIAHLDEDGDEVYSITEAHTINDIARWIEKNGWTDEVICFLLELPK